jgi:hypothetical protein
MSDISGGRIIRSGEFAASRPPPPPLSAAADITGWRSWWDAVVGLAWKTWRPGGMLLAWAVLPALPAAGIIASVAVAFEAAAGRSPLIGNTLPWQFLLIPAVVLVPFVIAGGYVVARAWTGAAWAAVDGVPGGGGSPVHDRSYRRRPDDR